MNTANSHEAEEIEELLQGFSRDRKTISPKYFYDEQGSLLFEQICDLPEYYLTRTEIGIMREHIGDMVRAIGPRVNVIEFGSGAGLKTRLLLNNLEDPISYIPVDISLDHLQDTASAMRADFPDLEILPVAADFTRPFPLPRPARPAERNLVYFPGSTIGNFESDQAVELLRVMHTEAGSDGALLIGIDLRKDIQLIENAYNDSAGITAKFNLNMLQHLNSRYGADFDLQAFAHSAVYDEATGRIEMRLVSQKAQKFSLGNRSFSLSEGEEILTEYCHKFSVSGFKKLAATAGFHHKKSWFDSRQWFSILLFDRAI